MRATDSTKTRTTRTARRPRQQPVRVSKPRRRILPRWVPVAASFSLVTMITLTINYRAYTVLQHEEKQNSELNQQVQQMTSENLNLQEEIYYLKNDSATIGREAKKYGLVRPQGKNSQAGEIDKAEESINRQTPTNK